jgi:CheY-like chemotaxis protein
VPGALAAVERARPNLIVTDLTMAGRGGIDLIKDLLALYPGLLILVYSMRRDSMPSALRAGAKGYVMKDADGPRSSPPSAGCSENLSECETRGSRARRLCRFAPTRKSRALEKLSDRELEVFRLFGEGKTAKEIARRSTSVRRRCRCIAITSGRSSSSTSAEMIRRAVRYVEQNTSAATPNETAFSASPQPCVLALTGVGRACFDRFTACCRRRTAGLD